MQDSSARAAESPYRLRTACPACIRRSTVDARTTDLSLRQIFTRAARLERAYGLRLRQIARIIDHIIRGFDVENPYGIRSAEDALKQYSFTIGPWARSVGQRMIAEVAQRDERSWFKVSNVMGKNLRKEIEKAPTGQVMQDRLKDQVDLITSLPREAAERVHKLALEGRIKGTRADIVAKEILNTGEVTKARANMIARTETTRTATELTKARAESIGSPGYLWVTVGDKDVRPTHKKLNGTFHRWDNPPVCDEPDHRAHPGCIWNCRCYPEVIIPGTPEFSKYAG